VKALGVKIFVGYLVASIALGILMVIMRVVEVYAIASLFSGLNGLLQLVARIGGMLHTHDTTVKVYPNLGQPIAFKK